MEPSTTLLMKIMKSLDLPSRLNIYKKFDYDVQCHLIESNGDYECKYIYELCSFATIYGGYEIKFPRHHAVYKKLYMECPYLKTLPQDTNIIVAGGFINIAIDDNLDYCDYPNSDIDIYIAEEDGYENLIYILKFFDAYGAMYKNNGGIIQVYLPNYNRVFQIVWINRNNVYDCIARFNSSNTKCGLHCGSIIAMPDCMYTIKTKIALIDEQNINAHTIKKIIDKKYIPHNFEKYICKDLDAYSSVKRHSDKMKLLSTKLMISSTQILNEVKNPITFKRTPCKICSESCSSKLTDEILIRQPIDMNILFGDANSPKCGCSDVVNQKDEEHDKEVEKLVNDLLECTDEPKQCDTPQQPNQQYTAANLKDVYQL